MSRSDRLGAGTARVSAVAVALVGFIIGGCGGPGRPNVMLIVVDTVRADRVSSYGYQRATTPYIDRLARAGIRFANASSTSSWTIPSHASLFTGVMPIQHGATQEHRKLDKGFATLAELLSEAGYETLAASGNPLVSSTTGLDRGFEHFYRTREPHPVAASSEHPNVTALRNFWRERTSERPFFAFVNFIEAHGPYDPPEPWRSRFLVERRRAQLTSTLNTGGARAYYGGAVPADSAALSGLSDLYDGEVAYVDALVGELLAELDRAALADDTLVILASDHGENIGDHGHFRHVFSLYSSTVRIPLVIRLPDGRRAGDVVTESVSLVELFPTILAAAAVAPPQEQPGGRDLLAAGRLDPQPVFAEYYYPLQALGSMSKHGRPSALQGFLRRLRSVEFNGLRLVWSSGGASEIYDVGVDPGELQNLAGAPEYSQHQRKLEQTLEDYVLAAGDAQPMPDELQRIDAATSPFGQLDDDAKSALHALGYLR
jgi:arylsulfatase A-like enzyme